MKLSILAGAAVGALSLATSSQAAIAIDGVKDAAYGNATASVLNDPTAPEGNFQTPGPTTDGESYNVYLTSDANNVYGFIQGTGVGVSPATFANLYFDIDPANNNGSDIGFEVTNNDIFVAGVSGNVPAGITFSTVNGNVEFSIPNADFTGPVSGLNYVPGQQFASIGSSVTLRLSQSLGYSVAGGATYGTDRLGSVILGGAPAVSAAPEPGSWLLMLAGVGMLGVFMRNLARRRTPKAGKLFAL